MNPYRNCLVEAKEQVALVRQLALRNPESLEMKEHRNCLVGWAEFRLPGVLLHRKASLKAAGLCLRGEALAELLAFLRGERPEFAMPYELLPYLVGLVSCCSQRDLPALCASVLLDSVASKQLGPVTKTPPSVLVYSTEAIVANLSKVDGMSEEEAQEHFEFNIAGDWVGEGTPLFL